jgi:hypothetical protein
MLTNTLVAAQRRSEGYSFMLTHALTAARIRSDGYSFMLTHILVAARIRSDSYSFMLTMKKLTSYITIYVTFLMVSAIWQTD